MKLGARGVRATPATTAIAEPKRAVQTGHAQGFPPGRKGLLWLEIEKQGHPLNAGPSTSQCGVQDRISVRRLMRRGRRPLCSPLPAHVGCSRSVMCFDISVLSDLRDDLIHCLQQIWKFEKGFGS